ncbi:unnamed protein product [Brachionus calyciflorus]|uniref:Dephospho-CoA kinase n=1 Tax=Brachionus calyciflorus TaxID=104777 RepID=A0A814IW86_9BILA|nr:unnamed protein product [Brachionus calyciflorus]
MFLVGLTGGIASGKSTVASIFHDEFNVPIIDADKIARKVVVPGRLGWKRVRKIFGNEILNQDQTINRDKLGDIIFNDSSKRCQLNKALHFLILLEIIKEIFYYLFKGCKFVILDIPLLFETKFGLNLLSYKLVVHCESEEEQLRRLRLRNPNLSEENAKNRIQTQMDTKTKLKMADYCIDNSKDLEYTRQQIKNIFNILNHSKKLLMCTNEGIV